MRSNAHPTRIQRATRAPRARVEAQPSRIRPRKPGRGQWGNDRAEGEGLADGLFRDREPLRVRGEAPPLGGRVEARGPEVVPVAAVLVLRICGDVAPHARLGLARELASEALVEAPDRLDLVAHELVELDVEDPVVREPGGVARAHRRLEPGGEPR